MKIIDSFEKIDMKPTFYQFYHKNDVIYLLKSVGQAILSD